jgi:hypothetical protein
VAVSKAFMTGLAIALAVLASAPMSVDVRSADGFVLKGSYFSPGTAGPAIVLYHQCDSDRHIWDRLAADLMHAGFHVLTFDARGGTAKAREEGGPRSRSLCQTSTPPTTGSPPNPLSTSRESPQEAAVWGRGGLDDCSDAPRGADTLAPLRSVV